VSEIQNEVAEKKLDGEITLLVSGKTRNFKIDKEIR
jgi:hypothetical protein